MSELILVVDDNPSNAKLVRVLLERSGYEVMVAGHADDALAALEQRVPSLILMDLQLPGTDGYTLTERLRAKPALATLPIVAVTAYAMHGDEARALRSGCNGYVTKPINTRTFVADIARYLSPEPGAGGRECANES